jgi:hypothetical protein
MDASERSEKQVFLVRLWREPAPEHPWRAAVTHVESGQRLVTTDLRAVCDFIRLQIGPDAAANVFDTPVR